LYLVWKEARSRNANQAAPSRSEEPEKLHVAPFNGSEPFNR
jgi:exopolysaccharide production repressor protein